MISGFYIPSVMPQPQIIVAMRVPLLNGGGYVGVPFVVDTGAARTVIHAFDAMGKFGAPPTSLDPNTWANPLPTGGVGGGILAQQMQADYVFQYDDGTFYTFSGTVLVGEASTQGLPSLLGVDVLSRFELRATASTVVLIPLVR